MSLPALLFGLSLLGVTAALTFPGMTDLLLLAGPCAIASLWLLLQARLRSPAPVPAKAQNWIVIDGSNVMHWQDGTPSLEPVRQVVSELAGQGYVPGVIFDANAGYKIADRYLHDGALARLLGLPADRVMVVPKGVQADDYILAAARDLKARVVTNDRYRDWVEAHPHVLEPGFLVRGGFGDGGLWLNLGPRPAVVAAG